MPNNTRKTNKLWMTKNVPPKKSILFVGAFGLKKKNRDKHTGGQLFACQSLLQSKMAKSYKWILIDSLASTNKKRPLLKRLKGAAKRMLSFAQKLPNADIVLLFSSAGLSFIEKGSMALWAKARNKPVVFAPRSGLIEKELAQNKWKYRFAAHVIARVDIVLTQSHYWQAYYHRLAGGNQNKYVYLPNWIDTRDYPTNKRKKSTLQKKQPIKVLFLGWIEKNKGIFELVEVAHRLHDLPLHFTLAGDGKDMPALQKKITQKKLEKKIHLPSWVNHQQKLDLLKKADIFVLPSQYDGYPNALLEAMASGLACIASNTGGIPDMILHKKTGLLIPPGNIDALEQALKRLLANPELRLRLGQAARNRVQQHNDLAKASERLHQLFSSLT